MIFIDQAQALLLRWEDLRYKDDVEDLAAATAAQISREANVPKHVTDALDRMLDGDDKDLARAIMEVTRYLRDLCEERREHRRTPTERVSA